MTHKRRRHFAFALVVCLLFGLLPGKTRAEETQTMPVADDPAAETPLDAVPATQTPTELTEAETVSLSEKEIRVIKGGTTTLTAEIPEAQRGQSPLTTASGIVWASSNPAVATVDSSGVVTGVELGEATITATLNGTVIEMFTVNIILENGYYTIENLSNTYCVHADEASMANSVTLSVMSNDYLDEIDVELEASIQRKWYIEHIEADYYAIYPAYSSGMVLTLFGGAIPVIRPVESATHNTWQWRITNGSFFYVLQNRYYSDLALEFPETDVEYADLGCSDYAPSSGSQNWAILSTFEPSGLLLYEKASGELIANSFDSPIASHTAYLQTFTRRTLGQLGLYVQVLDPSSEHHSYGMIFGSSSVSFNPDNIRITASAAISTTARVTVTVYGTQYYVRFNLFTYNDGGTLCVEYDHAYSDRYSDAVSRISNQMQILENKFLNDFAIQINATDPELFLSYADQCPYDYDENCACTTADFCNNHDNVEYGEGLHHKNAYNIFYDTGYAGTVKTLTYIGHNVCYQSGTAGHVVSTPNSSNYLNGLSYIWYNLAQVHDHRSLQAETATAVHEVGHLFGAPDHYSGAPNGWTLTGLNDLTNGNPFSAICIYGDQKEDPAVINNITICDGCKKVIRQEIILPDTPV